MKNPKLAILTLSSLLGSANVLADYPYQHEVSQPQYQENALQYSYEQQKEIMSSGTELHDGAIQVMKKMERGQLTPQERQMFQSIQQQANEMVNRFQNGQLTPEERQVFEGMQQMMKSPMSY